MIYGAGRLGRQVLHVLRTHFAAGHEVIGFVDDVQPAGTPVRDGLQVLGTLTDLAASPDTDPAAVGLVPAMGYADQPARGRALARARDLGYQLPTLRHPRAWVERGAEVGSGCILLAGVIVDQGASVADCCYLDQGVLVGEDTTVSPNCYLAAGSVVAGGVRIGRDTFLGAGSVVADGVAIGEGCVVNAQSLVHCDVPPFHKLIQTRDEVRLPLPAAAIHGAQGADHGEA
jgi:sugar O-acyltransferase (sialic acid O-acetyltransferase NeuD family)